MVISAASCPIASVPPRERSGFASRPSAVLREPCPRAVRRAYPELRHAGSSPARPAVPRFLRQRKGLQSAWRVGSCREDAAGVSCSCTRIWRGPSADAKALRHAAPQTESLPQRRVLCEPEAGTVMVGNFCFRSLSLTRISGPVSGGREVPCVTAPASRSGAVRPSQKQKGHPVGCPSVSEKPGE